MTSELWESKTCQNINIGYRNPKYVEKSLSRDCKQCLSHSFFEPRSSALPSVRRSIKLQRRSAPLVRHACCRVALEDIAEP